MIPIFVCEDNTSHRNKIAKCIQDYILMENFDMKVVLSSENPYEILEYLNSNSVNGVYFLDVDLSSDIDGIQLAETIRKYDPRGFIIFITTHEESLQFTFKYKVEALDYIIKDDIMGINSRICECLSNIYAKCVSRWNNVKRFTFKIMDKKFITIDCDRILYFETSPNTPRKVVLNSFDGRYEFYAKMEDILKKLDSTFFRCHRSFIVNIGNIKGADFDQKEIFMKDGSTCSVSVRHIKALKEIMANL